MCAYRAFPRNALARTAEKTDAHSGAAAALLFSEPSLIRPFCPRTAAAAAAAAAKALKPKAASASGGAASGARALPTTVDYTTMVATIAECKKLAVRVRPAPATLLHARRQLIHRFFVWCGKNRMGDLCGNLLLWLGPRRRTQVPARVQSVTLADEHTVVLGLRTLESKAWLHLSWHTQAARACLGPPPPVRPDADSFNFREVLKSSLVGLNLIDAAVMQARVERRGPPD